MGPTSFFTKFRPFFVPAKIYMPGFRFISLNCEPTKSHTKWKETLVTHLKNKKQRTSPLFQCLHVLCVNSCSKEITALGCDFFERVHMYACMHWNSGDVPVFFSDDHLCFFQNFFVILLVGGGFQVCMYTCAHVFCHQPLNFYSRSTQVAPFLTVCLLQSANSSCLQNPLSGRVVPLVALPSVQPIQLT
jgi:hypothetical protein